MKVGNDAYGEQMKQNFLSAGIAKEHILVTSEAASGVAPIMVDAKGYELWRSKTCPQRAFNTPQRTFPNN